MNESNRWMSKAVAIAAALLLSVAGHAVAANKLTPSQRDAVKRAEYHLSEAKKLLTKADESIMQLDAVQDLTKVPYGAIKGLEGSLTEINQKLTNVANALKEVPADAPEAAPIAKSRDEAAATVASHQAKTTAALAKLDNVRDIKNYPDFAADYEHIQTLAKAYDVSWRFIDRPEDLAALWSQADANLAWYKEHFAKYLPIMQQKTGEGNAYYAAASAYGKSWKEFRAKAQEFVTAAPDEIENRLTKANELVDKAVANKNPQFFDGGVAQNQGEAQKQLAVFAILAGENHEATKKLKAKCDEANAKIAKARDQLKEQIIASEKTPDDVYSGDDKAKLRGMIEAAWKKKYPNDKLVDIRFHVTDWKRDAGFRWDSGSKSWNAFDKSFLVTLVAVRTSDSIIAIYPAYVNKDNLSQAMNVGCDTKGGAYVVREMLAANWKP